jgi:hypothetical protein
MPKGNTPKAAFRERDMFNHSCRWPVCLAVSAVWIVGSTSGLYAQAVKDGPLWGKAMTQAHEQEVLAWGQAYFAKVEQAQPSTMVFSSAAMNSPLFNPLRGSRATLEAMNLVSASDCDRTLTDVDPTQLSTADQAKRVSIKNAMTASLIATDAVTNPSGTANHIAEILSSTAVGMYVSFDQNGQLVSEKLPLDVIVAAGAEPTFAGTLSVSTVSTINALALASPGYATFAEENGGMTEAQKLISGGQSRADMVLSQINTLLNTLGASSNGAFASRVDAHFGVYGQLPLVEVQFNDGFVLVDALNGAVSAPFATASAYDAREMIASHVGLAASEISARYYRQLGCTQLAAIWNLTPPAPPWNPMVPNPTLPPNSNPNRGPARDPSMPGWPSAWSCTTVAGVPGMTCICVRTSVWVNPGSPAMIVPEQCVHVGPCLNTPPLNTPGGGTPPGRGFTCQYWY